MKLTKRRDTEPAAVADEDPAPAAGKGRATPKRRDAVGPRGPVTAPKNRKEAVMSPCGMYHDAEKLEMQSLEKNGTWEFRDRKYPGNTSIERPVRLR